MAGTGLQAAVTSTLSIREVDEAGLALSATCVGVPPTTADLFSHGCTITRTDSGTGNPALYENTGTSASPSWNLIGSVTPSEIIVSNDSSFEDTNGNNAVTFGVVAAAVNSLKFTNAATGDGAALSVFGTDADADLLLDSKANGQIILGSNSTGAIRLESDVEVVAGMSTLQVAISAVNSPVALTVGPNGTTDPALRVDLSGGASDTGVLLVPAAAGGGMALSVISSGVNEALSIDAKGTGAITIGSVSTGGVETQGTLTTQSVNANGPVIVSAVNNANALAVGPAGSTDPALQVDLSGGASATGVKVTPAAAAGGVTLAAISSGANESLVIDAKGTGNVSIASGSTGTIELRQQTNINGGIAATGSAVLASGEALPAGGNTIARATLSSTADFGVYVGSGAPTVSAAKGSLYLRSDGTGVGDRAYIATDSVGGWTAITTVA